MNGCNLPTTTEQVLMPRGDSGAPEVLATVIRNMEAAIALLKTQTNVSSLPSGQTGLQDFLTTLYTKTIELESILGSISTPVALTDQIVSVDLSPLNPLTPTTTPIRLGAVLQLLIAEIAGFKQTLEDNQIQSSYSPSLYLPHGG